MRSGVLSQSRSTPRFSSSPRQQYSEITARGRKENLTEISQCQISFQLRDIKHVYSVVSLYKC